MSGMYLKKLDYRFRGNGDRGIIQRFLGFKIGSNAMSMCHAVRFRYAWCQVPSPVRLAK